MSALLVMGKEPRPGAVKTRLHPLLGPDGSAALQRALLAHTCGVAAATGLPTFLSVDPPDATARLAPLVGEGVTLLPQSAGHLGDRLTAAVDTVFATVPGPVLVIGVDAPTLTALLLTEAVALLADGADRADAVLGPALDGGYYLIGLRRPSRTVFAIDPALWGGDGVLTATLGRLRSAGLRVALLSPLRDLDSPEDAAALLTDPALPTAVAAHLGGRRAEVRA